MRTFMLALSLCMAASVHADELPDDQLATSIEAVIEAVLDHHIEPPTRHEMVLALLRHLHRHETARQLAELSRQVSDRPSKEALFALVRDELAQHQTGLKLADSVDHLDLSWLDEIVPGGVQFNSEKEEEVARQLAANRYVGIGVQMIKKDTDFVFPRVMENGTAAAAGILPGDRLLKVNDSPVEGELSDIIDQLRGPEGSQLRLTVQTGDKEPRDLDLRRQVIVIKTIRQAELQPNAKWAVLTVDDIKASSVNELQKIIAHLPETVTKIELNVQSCDNFHYFLLFADALLDEGVLGEVVTREGTQPIRTEEGNVLAGRQLKIRVLANPEQLFSFLAQRPDAHVVNSVRGPVKPLYIQESLPIMEGRAVLSLATRRFQQVARQ